MTSTLLGITSLLMIWYFVFKFVPSVSSPITDYIWGKQEMSFLETASVNSQSPSRPLLCPKWWDCKQLSSGNWHLENRKPIRELPNNSGECHQGARRENTHSGQEPVRCDLLETVLVVNSQALSLIIQKLQNFFTYISCFVRLLDWGDFSTGKSR